MMDIIWILILTYLPGMKWTQAAPVEVQHTSFLTVFTFLECQSYTECRVRDMHSCLVNIVCNSNLNKWVWHSRMYLCAKLNMKEYALNWLFSSVLSFVLVHPDGELSMDSLSPAHTLSSVPSPVSLEALSPYSLHVSHCLPYIIFIIFSFWFAFSQFICMYHLVRCAVETGQTLYHMVSKQQQLFDGSTHTSDT